MRAVASGCVALAALAWFALVAPQVSKVLTNDHQAQAPPALSVATMRRHPNPQVQARLDDLQRLSKQEQLAYAAIATVLTEDQRAEGEALQRDLPPVRENSRANTDVVALTRALLDTYGYGVLPPPEVTSNSPWKGADPITQTRSVQALARARRLDDEQAKQVLGRAFALLEVQVAKADLIDELQPYAPSTPDGPGPPAP